MLGNLGFGLDVAVSPFATWARVAALNSAENGPFGGPPPNLAFDPCRSQVPRFSEPTTTFDLGWDREECEPGFTRSQLHVLYDVGFTEI